MANVIGINPTQVDTDATFKVGQIGEDASGNQYVYVSAGSAVTANYNVVISAAYAANHITTTNGVYGLKVGVAPAAAASGSYFWAQIYGNATAQVLASCAANARVNTTATAGALDDDGGTGAKEIRGFSLSAARAATAGTAAAILNYPIVGATL